MMNQTMTMNPAIAPRQRGISLMGLIVVAIVGVIVAILLMKVIPTYIDNREIANILHQLVSDPDLQGATPQDIRNSFDKRALINDITVIDSSKLNIAQDPNGHLVISVKYHVKIPLAFNISLWIDFDTSSANL